MRPSVLEPHLGARSVLALGFLLCFGGCATYRPLPLSHDSVEASLGLPDEQALDVAVGKISHPLLNPIRLEAGDGISPAEAAVLAVVLNPALRAARDQANLAEAQLLQAGILPNPQIGGNLDYVIGGNTLGTRTGFGYGLTWDVHALLTRPANVTAARAAEQSVRLDIAWKEWQTALAAESAVYDLAALTAQVAQARDITDRLTRNSELVRKAEADHEMTLLDAAAATAAANDARAILLGLQRELARSRIALNRAIGYPPDTELRLQGDVVLSARVDPPSEDALLSGLEERRLDLLALRRGYDSQDAKLRGTILAQFPNINIGFNRSNNESDVHFAGPSATIDLPIFNRNQGNIAIERATRQQLFDEYAIRVFEARSDIAFALADIRSLNGQVAEAERALPALHRLVEVSTEALREGNADILGAYAAQNNLTRKSIEILQLKQQLAASRVALEAAAAWHLSP